MSDDNATEPGNLSREAYAYLEAAERLEAKGDLENANKALWQAIGLMAKVQKAERAANLDLMQKQAAGIKELARRIKDRDDFIDKVIKARKGKV